MLSALPGGADWAGQSTVLPNTELRPCRMWSWHTMMCSGTMIRNRKPRMFWGHRINVNELRIIV